MRQELRAPNASETLALGMLTKRLADGLAAGASPQNAQTIAALINQKAQLETTLKLGRTSQDVVNLLRQNDVNGATAAIEGFGEPERVLDEYLWTLLDIAYLGRQGTSFTDQTLSLFTPVAQRAKAYCQRILGTLPKQDLSSGDRYIKTKIAEIAHNIASFSLPDQGTTPPDLRALGQEMALFALQLRQELNQPYETMIANWMVGKYYLSARDFPAAKQYLQTSIDQATALNDLTGIAWGKTTMAAVLRAEIAAAGAGPLPPGASPDQAAALDKDVRDIIDKVGNQNALSNLLSLERPN